MPKIKTKTYGFGVDPTQSVNFFYVVINPADGVQVFECFSWTAGEESQLNDISTLRIKISLDKWKAVEDALSAEFNARLKADGLKKGNFTKKCGTSVERLFGKEMMILLWAVEDCGLSVVPAAIRNWKGLMPEERWWLYTMTNAATGRISDKKGWRIALRYALCENPI